VLDDAQAAEAEKLILDQVPGQPPGVVGKLAAQAVCTVDPDGAAKRREHAEREEARVRFWRDNGGACALAAYGLPTDAALAANAAIEDRARRYKQLKIRPDARLDQLRVLAFLDILNGITLETRLAQSRAAAAARERSAAAGPDGPAGPGPDGTADSGGEPSGTVGEDLADVPGPGVPDDDWFGDSGDLDGNRPGDYVDGHGESAASDPGSASDGVGGDLGGSGGEDQAGAPGPGVPDDDWFTGHPGDTGEPGDDWPGTYTIDRSESAASPQGSGAGDDSGLGGDAGDDTGSDSSNSGPGGGNPGASGGNADDSAATPAVPALAARANLTLPLATLLGLAERPGASHGLGPLDPALVRDLAAAAANSPDSELCVTITDGEGTAIAHGCAKPARKTKTTSPAASRDGPPDSTGWALTPRGEPGPADGYGTWTLTLPGGRQLTVKLMAVPVSDCDHQHESHGYQPSDTLRHLVQVRDGTCTFPTCSAHARDSDFEHAVPYHQGGRTCACNGGARSRRCHRVKQSPGWSVTQPKPGWHRWTTPSGRTYTQGPMRYPV